MTQYFDETIIHKVSDKKRCIYENIQDDYNIVSNKREIRQIISYEKLLTICDKVQNNYDTELQKLPISIQQDGSKHSNRLYHLHQLHLAIAINVWDFPKKEKYTLDIIDDENKTQDNKNYVLIQSGNICKFIFNDCIRNKKHISYHINCEKLAELNDKLDKLLKYSYQTYPRHYLFIGKNCWNNKEMHKIRPSYISEWIRDVVNDEKMCINIFRIAFITYYCNKFNNDEKQLMTTRMQTSKGPIYTKIVPNIDED